MEVETRRNHVVFEGQGSLDEASYTCDSCGEAIVVPRVPLVEGARLRPLVEGC